MSEVDKQDKAGKPFQVCLQRIKTKEQKHLLHTHTGELRINIILYM